MIKKTKAGRRGGSINVVIPSAIADLFDITEGSTIKWIAEFGDGSRKLCVETEE